MRYSHPAFCGDNAAPFSVAAPNFQAPARRHRQSSSVRVVIPSLNGSEILSPSTQKTRPSAASATSTRRRSHAGIFAFVKMSCSYTGSAMPLG